MQVDKIHLSGVLIITPKIFTDGRGVFVETFQQSRYKECGIAENFAQDNFSVSQKNTLRGLHFQTQKPQGKLVWVTQGSVLDTIVDLRIGSPTFKQFFQLKLTAETLTQIYIPPGFLHGFHTLEDNTHFQYKCTENYDAKLDRGVIWNDPELNIPWPTQTPNLSPKDQNLSLLKNVPSHELIYFSS